MSSFSDNKKDDDRHHRRRYADLYTAISPICEDFLTEVGITPTSAYSWLCRRRHNHDLRHTFGTRMAAAGVPMRTLQEWMGHRDFKTTLIYADYAPSANEAEIVNGAFAAGVSTNLSTNLSESGSNSNQEEPGNLD